MDTQNPKQQLLERLKTANNVLVTVRSNPSVDQLAACIGLTLLLNKQGKHATAVFSGEVPSTLEFLEPEATLEKNTDSLRDFIISLDKSKADKLRYKVEDTVVKIFITPYRTSLSADDLEYSQGDFNVDLVIALGVKEQQDLDNAITSHGRILHDATVATVNTDTDGNLGSINWRDAQASSLCELIVDVGRGLGKDLLDNQIATALLTGIVAETASFSNEKTTPQTMSVSAELMSNGANQQLVATKLEGPSVNLRSDNQDSNMPSEAVSTQDGQEPDTAPATKKDDGTLEIGHDHDATAPLKELPTEEPESATEDQPDVQPQPEATEPDEPTSHLINEGNSSKLVTEPPSLGGTLTANSTPEGYDPSIDPLSLPSVDAPPMLTHDSPAVPADQSPTPPPPETAFATEQPAPVVSPPPTPVVPPLPDVPQSVDAPAVPEHEGPETLAQLEQEVHSPHTEANASNLVAARDEVLNAINSTPDSAPPPVQALNAQPIELEAPAQLPEAATAPSLSFDPNAFEVANDPDAPSPAPAPDYSSPLGQSMTMPLPPSMPMPPTPPAQPSVIDPTAPPPVPPPIPFQFGTPNQNQNQQ